MSTVVSIYFHYDDLLTYQAQDYSETLSCESNPSKEIVVHPVCSPRWL